MLEEYKKHAAERATQGIPPLPLSAAQTAELVKLLDAPPPTQAAELLELFVERVPAGVDDAAYVKAGYLAALSKGTAKSTVISRASAVELLGTMLGGYNIVPLVELLDDPDLAQL